MKGPPGAFSNRIVNPSASLFVCLSICSSVCIIPSRLLTKCKNESLDDDTVTKLGLLWVPHISLTFHAPGVGRCQNVGLRDFCHILTLLSPGGICVSQTHV